MSIDTTYDFTQEGEEIQAIFDNQQNLAPKDSPAFTGVPTAPTPDENDSSTKIATTEFVRKLVLANMITDTASGATVSIPDGANAPVKALSIEVNPAQSGSGNPYPPGGGTNMFDEQMQEGTYSQSTGELLPTTGNMCSVNMTPIEPETEYVFVCVSARISQLFFYDENGDFISNKSNASESPFVWTSPAGAYFVNIQTPGAYGTTYKNDIAINPSGVTTYSPYSNIRPISGWSEAKITRCGTNIWDEEWEVGSYNADGTEYPSTARIRTKNYILVKPSTTYYFHTNGATADVHYYDKSKAHISLDQKTDATFTTPSGCFFIRFCMSVAYGTTYGDNLSINYPSTDTSYHAYNGTIYTVDLNGTMYGGMVDIVGGPKTEKYAYVTLTGDDIGAWGTTGGGINYVAFSITKRGVVDTLDMLCNQYEAGNSGTDKIIRILNSTTLRVYDNDRFPTQAAAVTALNANPLQVLYLMQTEESGTITPVTDIATEHGDNTISCDTGGVSVEYRADTALYIAKKITEATA